MSATQPATQPNFPPVTEIAVTSMALIVADAIYMASYLPEHVPLGPAIALLAVSAALMATNFILLIRVPGFNWRIFFRVARWALLAYAVISGLLAFVFVYDDTTGGQLVVLLLSFAVFAIHVPLLVGFTVARYADV